MNMTKIPLLAASLTAALALAGPAQARSYYGTVVDVDPVTAGGGRVERVCRNVGGYDRYDNRYDNRSSQYRHDRDPNRVGGAVAGAVIGGVLGNQIGDGDGRTAATVAGAVIGGLAGREIQDNRYNDNRYNDNRYGYQNSDRYGYTPNPGYQECWNERRPGGRVVAYDVTYRVDGRIYTTRTNYQPALGSRIRVDRTW